MKFNKVILAILDGFGVASPAPGNAITSANPKFFQELIAFYPTKVLQASGPAVGLSWGERGNSEVGHLNMGAGRVVAQELPLINRAINDGSFYQNESLKAAMDTALKNNSTLHIVGLIGPGAVHAYEQHLYALWGMARDLGVKKIAFHLFTDGRDAPPRTSLQSIEALEKKLAETPGAVIATVTGRFYAMDRGEHWQQTESTLAALNGVGPNFAGTSEAVGKYYEQGLTDDMIPPTVIADESGQPRATINKNDAAIFFNFRNDRMIQLVKLFLQKNPEVFVATMTTYDPSFEVKVAFPPLQIKDSLGEIISSHGFKQFRAAESEKFAHVTFFFNGHRHEPWPGEEREIIKSPAGNSSNYEDIPEMSAEPLTEAVVKRIKEKDDKFVLVNYANGDMVGHTGSLQAAKAAVQVLDESMAKLAKAADETGSVLIITSDHGNCESMINSRTAEIETEHSSNPVPLIFYAESLRLKERGKINLHTLAGLMPEGILPDVAPTVLKLLGLEVPAAMTGKAIEVE